MRFELITPESIQIRESLGLVKDIYDPTTNARPPLSEYRTMLDLVHRDPTLGTAFEIITDFSTYRGFDFTGAEKSKRDKMRVLFEKLNFQQILPNLVRSLLYYGDAFLELRKNSKDNSDETTPNADSEINELWVLETTEMRIMYNEHGKVAGYVQRPFRMAGMTEEEIKKKELDTNPETGRTFAVFFSPDEVVHFRMKWVGSQVYSYNPNEPILQAAATRLYAGNYLMNIFINMPPRYVAHLAGVSPLDYDKAKHEFQSAKTNYKKTIAFTRSADPNSKLTMQKIEPPFDTSLLEVIKWLNNEILKITRVPRTWVEGSNTENRGVGESLNLPFEVMIHSIHSNVIEPSINNILLPLLGEEGDGEKKVKIKFNEISRKGETEILQNAGLLRDMGLKPDALVKYLDERGILGTDPDDFEEMQLQKNMELNPSRQRMNPGKENMTQNRNEAGTSDSSAKKMGIKK
jgi:hypothetical protein